MHGTRERIVLAAGADQLDELIGFVAAGANHETNRFRRKRLDETFAVLNDAVNDVDVEGDFSRGEIPGQAKRAERDTPTLTARWRSVQMDLWDREALDLVAPAFIAFKPVAEVGTVGFSGDGGPATSSQLNNPAGITFGPDGILYIADNGNGRIRAVSPTGIITTIAGSGAQGGWVADATPALDASLHPTAMAFGLQGAMYVAAQREVLRLEPNGTFTRMLGEDDNNYDGVYGIGGLARSASADNANGIAFDTYGNMYVSGSDTKAILVVDPKGIVEDLGNLYPRGPSGLVTAADGSVVAMDELGVVGLSPQGITTLVSFPRTNTIPYLGITGFSPNGIAAGPDGTLYLDTFNGNGYADKSALIMIPAQGLGSPSLLWAQHSP